MIKKVILNGIKLYQKIPGSFHGYCKHVPTCSQYAYEAIEIYGPLKGSILAFKRIIKCNPFGSFGYDPVPKKENKNEK